MKMWIVAMALATGVATVGVSQLRAEESKGTETKVALADCPKAVQDAINKAAAGGTVGKIEKETENGKTTYEAKVTVGGKKSEIKVAEDGTVIPEDKDDVEDEDGGKDVKKGS